MTNVDGTADTLGDPTADPNNWRYYRYRVYERVFPLRNMMWGTCAMKPGRFIVRRAAQRSAASCCSSP